MDNEKERNEWAAEKFGFPVYRDDTDFVRHDDEEGKTVGFIFLDAGIETLWVYAHPRDEMHIVPDHLWLGIGKGF